MQTEDRKRWETTTLDKTTFSTFSSVKFVLKMTPNDINSRKKIRQRALGSGAHALTDIHTHYSEFETVETEVANRIWQMITVQYNHLPCTHVIASGRQRMGKEHSNIRSSTLRAGDTNGRQ